MPSSYYWIIPTVCGFFVLAIVALVFALLAYTRVFTVEHTPHATGEPVFDLADGGGGGDVIYQHAKQATVTIISEFPNSSSSNGSGFVIGHQPAGKHILIGTCAHILLQGEGVSYPTVKAEQVEVVLSGANGDPSVNIQVLCVIVGLDVAADIGVLRTLSTDEHPNRGFDFTTDQAVLEWGDSDTVIPGEKCYVVGNPLGADFASIASGTVRDAKYVGTFESGTIESLYTSAPILPGNSGSSVLSSTGKLIGLSSWVTNSSNVAQSSFAGGPNQHMAEQIINHIVATNADFQHKGYLGVTRGYLVAGSVLRHLAGTTCRLCAVQPGRALWHLHPRAGPGDGADHSKQPAQECRRGRRRHSADHQRRGHRGLRRPVQSDAGDVDGAARSNGHDRGPATVDRCSFCGRGCC